MSLTVKRLTVLRDERVVIENLSEGFPNRSITLLTGRNGSGKSTLLGTIAGDLVPSSGEISLDGISLIGMPTREAAKFRGVLQQRNEFTLGFQAGEILESVIRHCSKDSPTRSLKALAVELDLRHLLDRSILELSGGERQRVSLAIALAREVPLYLLDEPLSAQDAEHCSSISRYLEKIAKAGATFVIATHQSRELAEVATKEMTLTRS